MWKKTNIAFMVAFLLLASYYRFIYSYFMEAALMQWYQWIWMALHRENAITDVSHVIFQQQKSTSSLTVFWTSSRWNDANIPRRKKSTDTSPQWTCLLFYVIISNMRINIFMWIIHEITKYFECHSTWTIRVTRSTGYVLFYFNGQQNYSWLNTNFPTPI